MKKNLTTAVICTIKDDPIGLRSLLHDVCNQTIQPTELVLVFAGIDTKSEEILKNYQDKLPLSHYVLSPKATRSFARNFGVHTSKSEVILFTDAGCHLDKNWIQELLTPFHNGNVELVSGFTDVWSHSDWERAQAAFVLVPREKIEKHPLPATRNMALLRKTFVKNTGFKDELNFAEDFEFARRLRSQGIHAEFAPKAKVSWQPRKSYFSFFTMILRLTMGDMQSSMLRLGHLSMIVRYFVFFLLFFLMWSFTGLQNALFLGLLISVIYLATKTMTHKDLSATQKCWYATFIPFCDFAVILGVISGLAQRLISRENRRA